MPSFFPRSLCVALSLACSLSTMGAEAMSPDITSLSISNSQVRLNFTPLPGTARYDVLGTSDLAQPFILKTGTFATNEYGSTALIDWTAPATGLHAFYTVAAEPISSNALLSATLLTRLGYGATPDDLDRLAMIGPDAYIDEQLAPETIQETLDIDRPAAIGEWEYVTATGTGSSSSLYVYLTAPGEGYIDDIKLVAGSVAEQGVNLLRNGDFEQPLTTSDWVVSPNHAGSEAVSGIARPGSAGTSSLHITANQGGSTRSSAIVQEIAPALSSSRTYTLSYWFMAKRERPGSLTIRLSQSGLVSSPDSLFGRLQKGGADIEDLRAWHVMHGVRSKRQLLEVLVQFLENHFVTQYTKSRDYFDRFYSFNATGPYAAEVEFKENWRWRQALQNLQCTFYDLLKISAESPAMIIYLDTVNSRGDGRNIANENYARELLELFTFGVDNGYDQNDIVETSKTWTGWSVALVASTNEYNPFAPRLTDLNPGVNVTNLVGVWAFKYRDTRHNTSAKTIFPGKKVDARFGAPWVDKRYGNNTVPGLYELRLPARSGTNGIRDGYEVIAHLADLPFTQEYLSVKLCRLFVHDDFHHGYDFTDAATTPEENLVRECMLAWENSSPRGQIRVVLRTIFNSELFRSKSSVHKVKTPLEFTISTVRSLRAQLGNGTFTADSDGYDLRRPMDRMGRMRLFDRDDPDGYPESAPPWISAGTLAERLRFVQATLLATGQTGKDDDGAGDDNITNPVALLKLKRPAPADWNRADVVADFFLGILFPAEGTANLQFYRTLAINYLNTADNGVTASPLANLSSTTVTYDNRVRGMVTLLLASQRFEEQ